ncbi:MAG: RNA polymerase factor sigma-54, partial [Caulobacter sp.]|nr:RNA polymerase factor sigma-54 [Caulobacter sp.]
MALSHRLELRQGQGLVITPQLQQAIKLLQLSNIELDAFVEAELERNPLLQRDEGEAEPALDGEAERDPSLTQLDVVADTAASREMDAPTEDVSPGERATGDGAEAEHAGGQIDWSRAGSGGSFDGDEGYESALVDVPTLSAHLRAQLVQAALSPARNAIAEILIDAVDEGGYLRLDVTELAGRLGCALAMVEEVLTVLQGFEPAGVFARDVRECLALQLKDLNRYDPAMAAMLDHLELLAKRDMAGLRRVCGVDDEDLRDMIAEVRALNPRPGAAYHSEPAETLVPDVMVREGLGGMWHVELNTDTLPRVLVDQRYHARVAKGARSDQEKTFVADCMASANWLVKSLDQRAKTILKVSSEIVRQQDGFLAFGVEHLRPLNLKTVADAIGMHESTVSRVTSNKYLSCPRGLYELKYFFTSGVAAADGDGAVSAEAVKSHIKALIGAEEAHAILSDDTLVDLLRAKGMDIARRTVAKYREAI